MWRGILVSAAAVAAAFLIVVPAKCQTLAGVVRGNYFVPGSSIGQPGDAGKRVHTNCAVLLARPAADVSDAAIVYDGSPNAVKAIYGLPSTGGSKTIVIVDAFDDPTAVSDFNTFSAQYGLPQETGNGKVLKVYYANGGQPTQNTDWNLEESLDIEWAHALAPSARIVLAESTDNGTGNMYAAVTTAAKHFLAKEVSMSWSTGEYPEETGDDGTFTHPGTVFFAADGDAGSYSGYPACSHNVVACGGTNLVLDSNSNFLYEEGASFNAGGPSSYEKRPAYQNVVKSIVGKMRGTPDVSFESTPYVEIYCTQYGGWVGVIGTSVATPCLAALSNLAGSLFNNTPGELTHLYSDYGNSSDFYDETLGATNVYSCEPGYDFVTGVGSPRGLGGM